MMKKWILATLTVATMSITQVTLAKTNIPKFFKKLETFSANFSQTVKQEGKVVQQSRGTVQLKKPIKFRWDYQLPEKMQLVSDGKKFYHYDIELAQATVKPAKDVTNSALSTLLSDKKNLNEVFSIQSISDAAIKKQFPNQAQKWLLQADEFYQLKPKNSKNAVAKKVILGLNTYQQLSVFYVQDDFGDNTFLFTKIRQNKQLDDKLFLFSAPAGVDILGE